MWRNKLSSPSEPFRNKACRLQDLQQHKAMFLRKTISSQQ
jgi:hypothetical protein